MQNFIQQKISPTHEVGFKMVVSGRSARRLAERQAKKAAKKLLKQA